MRRLALAFLLVAVLAGAARAAPRQQEVPVGILAIGDFGVGGSTERRLGDAMRRFQEQAPADVLVTLGDNDYTQSPSRFRTAWNDSFGWLEEAGVDVAGALGNHDVRVQRGRYQYPTLKMPGPYYRRSVGNVDLFFLDSNAVTRRQTAWLEGALKASKARWRIAVFHHPAFTCGAYHSNHLVDARWVPLFERYRVRLALSGHDHNYQRFAPRHGVTYIVHGGGGNKYYRVTRCPRGNPPRARARREFGWLYLSVTDGRITGSAVNVLGRTTDRFTILP